MLVTLAIKGSSASQIIFAEFSELSAGLGLTVFYVGKIV